MKITLYRSKLRERTHIIRIKTKKTQYYSVPWFSEIILLMKAKPDLRQHEEVRWDGYIYLSKGASEKVRWSAQTKKLEVLNMWMARYDVLMRKFTREMVARNLAIGYFMYAPMEWFSVSTQIPSYEEI